MEELQINIRGIVEERALYGNVPKYYDIIKRMMDIMLSLIAIVLLLPLFAIIACLIRMESGGPVIFRQERTGYKGKVFKMLKFRSMVVDAEHLQKDLIDQSDVSGKMFKMKNDPRITRVGRIIRKTSMDELPQLFNVLRGDMSIVGPRPPIIREVMEYDPWHKLRMSAMPGLTGLWQVSGRNSVGFDEMVRLDLKYIRERNLFYDFKIMLRTIPVLLGDTTAF